MPPNTGIENSDGRGLTSTPTGDRLTAGLPILTGAQGLTPASRSSLHVVMPTLAFHIRQWLGHIREKGGRLAEWITNHVGVGLTSSQVSHQPMLMPAFTLALSRPAVLSPVWQRLVDLVWFRRHQKQNDQPLGRLSVTDKEQSVNDQNIWPSELRPTVIRNLLPPSSGVIERHDFPPQTQAITGLLPAGQLEVEDISQYEAPDISSSKISSTTLVNQTQNLDYHITKDRLTQADWQARHSYQSRWSGEILAPSTHRLGLSQAPITGLPNIISQIIRSAYATPVWHRSYLADVRERDKPDDQIAQILNLPYITDKIANIPEVMPLDEGTIEILGGYHRPVDLEIADTVPYSLPDRNEPAQSITTLKEAGHPTMPKTVSIFQRLKGKLLKLNKEPASGLLTTRVVWPQISPISQAGQSQPLVKPLPSVPLANPPQELTGQKAEVTNLSEESGNMATSQVMPTPVTTDSISPNQQEGQTEEPLMSREFPSATGLRHLPLSTTGLQRQLSFITESIYQMPTLSDKQYFQSLGNTAPLYRSEEYSFPEKPDYESYPLQYEDTYQPVLEVLSTSIADPRPGSNKAGSEGSRPAMSEGTAHYGGQPTPELALAPLGLPAESVSVQSPRAEAEVEETTQEADTIDLDAIAHDVYNIIKWWLGEEREWA